MAQAILPSFADLSMDPIAHPMARHFAPILGTFLLLFAGCAHSLPKQRAERPFNFDSDAFSFANETVWNYQDGQVHPASASDKRKERYSRRCFVMSRAAVQFWKFAHFEPEQKPLTEEELSRHIREVTQLDVWREPLSPLHRVIFPGYSNLKQLSAAHPRVFQENIGLGWPTYFRLGNIIMPFKPAPEHQARINRELQSYLSLNHPRILWLVNFPALDINHVVVAYGQKEAKEKFIYSVYDPNLPDDPRHLEFDPKEQTFSFEKTFYFKGGPVSVWPVYSNTLQ